MKIAMATALVLTGCSVAQPRLKPVLAQLQPPPPMAQGAIIPRLIRLTLRWDYPTNMERVVKFRIYHGTASGTYFEQFDTDGITNGLHVAFMWVPGQLAYFVATSVADNDLESLPSNEVKWPVPTPVYYPNNFVLSWAEPQATVYTANSLSGPWTSMGTITGTSLVVTNNLTSQFYKANVRLTIKAL